MTIAPLASSQSGNRRRRSHRRRAARRTPTARCVRGLTIGNLASLFILWFLLRHTSEDWWVSAALTYLPRFPYVVPALVLLGGSIVYDRRSAWWNLVAVALVAGPIAQLQIPIASIVSRSSSPAADARLKLVSCNVQGYSPDFPTVLQEIAVRNPDVVAFQECRSNNPLIEQFFADWHTLHVGEFWVGSRFPLRKVGTCRSEAFNRMTALKVEIEAPWGTFLLVNLHLMTARHGLYELSWQSILNDQGAARVERWGILREEEAYATQQFAIGADRPLPLLVVGDFNVPSSSKLFQRYWSDLANAFDTVGFGYGYTSPCSPHRFWFDGVPWIRVDHILTSQDWHIHHCDVGQKNGSDHRLISAIVSLR